MSGVESRHTNAGEAQAVTISYPQRYIVYKPERCVKLGSRPASFANI